MSDNGFFVGWETEIPRTDRRFLLGAGLALLAGGGALGAGMATDRALVGDGVWDQGTTHTLRGVVTNAPYPALRTRGLDGALRTVFLVSSGKTALSLSERYINAIADVTGTLITRGQNAMMAVTALRAAAGDIDDDALAAPVTVDRGSVMLTGEILDAKCWFGAIRPGYGKTHKACAALCARGGLPLAFCQTGACGAGAAAPLLLDENGRAFGRNILPFVADPVMVRGRLASVGDVLQIRARFDFLRRL